MTTKRARPGGKKAADPVKAARKEANLVVRGAKRQLAALPPGPETRGEKVIRFIEKYCRVPDGMLVGQPIILDPFQRKFILDVYDNPHGTEMGILSTGRKNAKTALIACLVIVHTVGPEAKLNSEIISGAMSRDQAGKVFNYAAKIIRLNPRLKQLVQIIPSQKKLIGRPMNVTYQAVAADGSTAMGGSPLVAILDETGQIRGSEDPFVNAIITSQGAHAAPLLLVISTQAENDTDLLSIWIDDALANNDPHTICHLYAADEGCDVMDEKAWYASNPALGTFRSLPDMVKMAKKASRMPSFENSFRNLFLNQRVSAAAPFVNVTEWKACGGKVVPIEQCEEIYGAIDLSGRADLTALILLGRKGKHWYSYCYFWTPEKGLKDRAKKDRAPYVQWHKQGLLMTTPGATVDYEFVAADIKRIVGKLDVTSIAYDRWRVELLKKEMDKIDFDEIPLIEWGQGFKDMSVAIDELESHILNHRLRHGMNPILTMCAANAKVVKDPAGNRKLDKKKSSGRIDGIVALAMASGLAARSSDSRGDVAGFIAAPLSIGF